MIVVTGLASSHPALWTHQSCGSQDDDHGAPVVQAEDVVVDAGRVPLVEEAGDGPEYHVKHGERFTESLVSLVISHIMFLAAWAQLLDSGW